MPNVQIQFAVEGANSALGWIKTRQDGEAIFVYTGSQAGTDVIQARMASIAQSLTSTWLEVGMNQPPVISVDSRQSSGRELV